MARSYEELTPEERLDAALSILALDFVGQLKRVESELDLDSKTVKRIKSIAVSGIEKALSDEEESELTFEINIKDGLARIKQSVGSSPSNSKSKGVGVKSRRSIPSLSEDQIERIRIIFTDLEEFNKKQPATKKLKPSEGLLKSALDFFGIPAPVVINKLPQIMKDKIATIDEAFKKHYPEGYPKRPDITGFMTFLEKKYPNQSESEE